MNDTVTRLPSWRQAVDDFLREFQYGDMVPLSWLEVRFDLVSVEDSQRLTAEQFRDRQFAWLASIEQFKDCLLREHQVLLQSVRGRGYRWVPPHEQTGITVREFEQGARKLFRMTGNRLRNLRHTELTDDQRRESADALTKLSTLRGMARRVLR